MLKWLDFCPVLIVRRLAPLSSHNTQFRSVPVSCDKARISAHFVFGLLGREHGPCRVRFSVAEQENRDWKDGG